MPSKAEDGSRLWLRQADNAQAKVNIPRSSPTLNIAAEELQKAWKGLPIDLVLKKDKTLQADGFRISYGKEKVTLTSPTEVGLLYGAYHLLRGQDTQPEARPSAEEAEVHNPAYTLRILNHWDNLDRTVERGYAGRSLWNWEELPQTASPRYEAYARANASIGINGTVLNNVNASPKILTEEYLKKVKALADIFRPYGLRVYLSVNFASPMALDSLPTADPLNKEVIRWWKNKAKEIYRLIPDFGGFLVKANSEGQPGPCDFGRTHADGANMLADVLKPYKGIVMWRAFVYSPSDADRAKQAYLEFEPLDGQFRKNVIIQIKNGPIDFQPREPYSPLFGAMPQTTLMAEFQITQEYLGHSNHLAYLAPMWKEFFEYVSPASLKAIAGVTNIGTDTNWCGHPLAQANWYAFGRLAWNPSLTSEEIADEWLKQTVYKEPLEAILKGKATDVQGWKATHAQLIRLMTESREAVVNYMMPLGLHHIFAWGHHYGPEPWCTIPNARPDWLPSYYHQADKTGLGFDRSAQGSNATGQYPEELAKQWNDLNTCPEKFLLWFHHVPWTHRMKSGQTLWDELCHYYDKGVRQVRDFQQVWDRAEAYIDPQTFSDVQCRLKTQVRDAVWWKDACLLYFQEFSAMPIPYDVERPIHNLKDLQKVHLPINNYVCPSPELLNQNR
ncbi:MAG: alpha-glucuronidase [Bacteroides sp.]|nr:alpha-glucuronidase [Bacteroides sp.]